MTAQIDNWRSFLERRRIAVGLERGALAKRAGVSLETVRGYETGRRKPTRRSLDAIMRALELTLVERNAVRADAGLKPERMPFAGTPGYAYEHAELSEAVARTSWPHFVTNTRFEILAANAATRRLWGWREQNAGAQHLITLAIKLGLPERVENFRELVTQLSSQLKNRGRQRDLADVAAYLRDAAPEMIRDPQMRELVLRAFAEASPAPVRVRWNYGIRWCDPAAGPIDFRCIVSTANESEGLEFNDWIPTGAQSWRNFLIATRE